MKVFLRTPYNYDMDAESVSTGLECKDPTLAQQSAAEEADINNIMEKYARTGQLPDNFKAPQYADFEEIVDYQTALNAIRSADESFYQLPAEVRSYFGNQPQALIEFLGDPQNRAQAEKLGLVVPNPQPTEITSPSPSPSTDKQ